MNPDKYIKKILRMEVWNIGILEDVNIGMCTNLQSFY